jgi:hypothetical protein
MSNDETYSRVPFRVFIIEFICENCGRQWKSTGGSLTDYQICKNCCEKCYPGRYKLQVPNKKGSENRETFISHDSELCGKCIRLGYSCMGQGIKEEPSIVVSNEDGKELRLGKSDLSSVSEIESAKENNKKKRKDAIAEKSKQVKKNEVDKSTPIFFNDVEREKDLEILLCSAESEDNFIKHVEILEVEYIENVIEGTAQIGSIMTDENFEQYKANCHDQPEPNDNSANSNTAYGGSISDDPKERTEVDQ